MSGGTTAPNPRRESGNTQDKGDKFAAGLVAISKDMEPRLGQVFSALSQKAKYTLLALGRIQDEAHFNVVNPISFDDFAKKEFAHRAESGLEAFTEMRAELREGLQELREHLLITNTDRIAFFLNGELAYTLLTTYLELYRREHPD